MIFDGFYNHRVFAANRMYPGLNMSRALGDTLAHREAGLSAVPDVQEYLLKSGAPGTNETEEDISILLCSDGVWEFIDAQEASNCVMSRLLKSGTPYQAVDELAKISWNSWMNDSDNEISDDITAMMINLTKIK